MKPKTVSECISEVYDDLRRSAVILKKQGYSYREISKKLGVSLGFISKWIKINNKKSKA